MALVKGTNCGFVTTAPTTDPAANDQAFDNKAFAFKDTSPATAAKITEIGWYCDNTTEAANFEVGLYSPDGLVAGTRLYIDTTNAKGAAAGWKTATVAWDISESTVYWIAVSLGNTATTTNINLADGPVNSLCVILSSTLPTPFGDITSSNHLVSIYAVWEAAPTPPVAAAEVKKTGKRHFRWQEEEEEKPKPKPKPKPKVNIPVLSHKLRGEMDDTLRRLR